MAWSKLEASPSNLGKWQAYGTQPKKSIVKTVSDNAAQLHAKNQSSTYASCHYGARSSQALMSVFWRVVHPKDQLKPKLRWMNQCHLIGARVGLWPQNKGDEVDGPIGISGICSALGVRKDQQRRPVTDLVKQRRALSHSASRLTEQLPSFTVDNFKAWKNIRRRNTKVSNELQADILDGWHELTMSWGGWCWGKHKGTFTTHQKHFVSSPPRTTRPPK